MAKLITAVVLIVGVGTVFGMLGYSLTMPKSEVVVNDIVDKKEIEDDEIIEDETADWKTYRNEEIGFEMKHPKFWLVEKHDISGIIYVTTEDIEEMRKSYSGDMPDLMTINVYQSTEEFLKEYNYKNFELIDIEDYLDKYSNIVDSPIENVELFNVAGIKGHRANVRDFGGGINYYIQVNEHVYVIWFFAGGEYSSEEFFSQIISTFKFIEKDETADWQTYRNEEYGFEVKYPDFFSAIEKSYGKEVLFIAENKYACVTNIEIFEENIDSYDESLQSNEMTKIISKKDIFLNDYKGREIRSETSEMGLLDICILLFHNSKTYKICSCEEADMEEIFDQILSTFKFIEKDETADWKTYRNEEYGFKVKYPEYWNNIIVNESRDFLNKESAVTLLFENFPERNNPRFVGYSEGINIKIYSKNYSCGPDEYNCAIYNCEEGFEGEAEHKRPADSGVSDYLIIFCKNVGNKEFLPAVIRYNYFIEENETNENIKNPITLQRINEFKTMVDSFKFIEK